MISTNLQPILVGSTKQLISDNPELMEELQAKIYAAMMGSPLPSIEGEEDEEEMNEE